MTEAFAWLSTFSPIVQILLVLGVALIFRKEIVARIYPSKQDEEEHVQERSSKDWFDDISDIANKQSSMLQSLMTAMGQLSEHYNHDTTEILSDIRDDMRELLERHKIYEQFGIKVRDCDRA